MERILLSLSTLVCALAGWLLAGSHSAPVTVAPAESPVTQMVTPPPMLPRGATADVRVLALRAKLQPVLAASKRRLDYHNLAIMLFAEVQDLPTEALPSLIAEMASQWENGRGAAALLAGLWAERDLPAARAWLLAMPEIPQDLASAVFDTWRRADANGLLDWAEGNAKTLRSARGLTGARYVIAATAPGRDPERTLRILTAIENTDSPFEGRAGFFAAWGDTAPEAAVARALKEPDEAARARFLSCALSRWALRDLAAAGTAVQQLPDPALADHLLGEIVIQTAHRDPRKAADFLVRLPQTDGVIETMATAMSRWEKNDPIAQRRWILEIDEASPAAYLFNAAALKTPPEEIEAALATLPPERRARAEKRLREVRDAAQSNSQK